MTLQALDELEAFADARAHGIGGTDAPAIMGLSPWSTAFDVYLSKTEPPEEKEPPLHMWLGVEVQSTVAKLLAQRTGVRLRAAKRQRIHPQFRWQRCHLDYVEWGNPKHIVECKTTSQWDDWGKQGSTKVPVHYWVQVQHQMAVTGADCVTIATLFGLRDFRWYDIERDQNFIDKLTLYETEFWHSYVLPRVPPPVDGSAGASRYLRRRNPVDNGLVRPATPEQNSLAERYRIAAHNADATAEALAVVKQQLIDIIGADAGLKGSDFEISYRKPKDPEHTDWKLVSGFWFRLLEELPPEVLAGPLANGGFRDMPLASVAKGVEGLYTSKSEGSRRFLWRDFRSEVEE